MGLDSFWKMPGKKPGDDDALVFDPPLKLCGGMLSGGGQGSFRGKVYNAVINGVSGYSLYEDELTNAEVKRISSQLESTSFKKANKSAQNEFDYWDITEEEYEDLKRMFREYADCGATLISWY